MNRQTYHSGIAFQLVRFILSKFLTGSRSALGSDFWSIFSSLTEVNGLSLSPSLSLFTLCLCVCLSVHYERMACAWRNKNNSNSSAIESQSNHPRNSQVNSWSRYIKWTHPPKPLTISYEQINAGDKMKTPKLLKAYNASNEVKSQSAQAKRTSISSKYLSGLMRITEDLRLVLFVDSDAFVDFSIKFLPSN